MSRLAFLTAALVALPCVANAGPASSNFPTHAVAYYVFECMADHGGNSWGNLYNCSCKIDAIASQVDYEEYVALDTAKRGRRLAGERGGVLRETDMAEGLRERMEQMELAAERSCFDPPPGASAGG